MAAQWRAFLGFIGNVAPNLKVELSMAILSTLKGGEPFPLVLKIGPFTHKVSTNREASGFLIDVAELEVRHYRIYLVHE